MKTISAAAVLAATLAGSGLSASAATLDDVMARLDSLQRDNQAMRKEIAALRQKEARSSRSQPVVDAPNRTLPSNVSTAMAADLPARGYYKAAPVEGSYNWTGFYAGGNAGYAFGKETSAERSLVPPTAGLEINDRISYDGYAGGIQAGYNYQVGQFVFGVEADIQAASVGERFHIVDPITPLSAANKLDSFGTVRGRIGYAFDRLMPYVTGGFAAGRNTFTFTSTGSVQDSAIHTGWTAGGGVEYGIGDHWSVKAEYLYVDLNEQRYFNGAFRNESGLFSKPTYSFARGGVNYRF